ncbi:MAG: transposase [Gemmatimonadetes bacterium]|nr:transposase [Gemmatimonadota bacterium]
MSQGILPYRVAVAEGADAVTGRAGLPLVLETMRALGLDRAIAQHVTVRQRASGYTEAEKIEALVLLLAAGGDCLDDIAVRQADGGLGRLWGRKLPSADALRHFRYAFHADTLIAAAQAQRRPDTVAYIPEESAALQGLGCVNTALVRRVAGQGHGTQATLDPDATIQESHKREALPHYQGGRGYQPAAISWVEQDLVVADEYRDGNVPAGMETLPLIQRGFASLPATVTEYAFRADSACYDERTLKWLADPQRKDGPRGPIGFTISADMTEPLRALCVAVPEPAWTLLEERPDETVHCSEVAFTPGDWRKDAWPLRYLVLRIRKQQGQLFGTGADTKYLAVVSNRAGEVAALLRPACAAPAGRWHWQKPASSLRPELRPRGSGETAGTIELVHAVTKNGLGAAVPPCGRFGANAAWHRLSLLTYNVLSALKSLALPASLSAARPKRLRFAVFTLAGRLVSHAGCLWVRVGAAAERLAGLIAARVRLALIAQALPAG